MKPLIADNLAATRSNNEETNQGKHSLEQTVDRTTLLSCLPAFLSSCFLVSLFLVQLLAFCPVGCSLKDWKSK